MYNFNCSDLVYFPATDEIFIAYDKKLVLKFSFLKGIRIRTSSEFDITEEKYEVYSLKEPLSYAKRRKLEEILLGVLNKKTKLTFKEKLNFNKFIIYIFKTILNIELTKENAFDNSSILNSDKLIKLNEV